MKRFILLFIIAGLFLAGCEIFPERYETQGDKFFSEKKYKLAINEYNIAIRQRKHKNEYSVYKKIGLCYLHMNQFNIAKNYIQKAIELESTIKPEMMDTLYTFGGYLLEDGNKKEALLIFEFISRQDPEYNLDAYNDLLIDYYISTHNYVASIGMLKIKLEKMEKENPERYITLRHIADAYYEIENDIKAVEYYMILYEDYKEYLARFRERMAKSCYNLGEEYYYSNRYEEALDVLKLAADIEKKKFEKMTILYLIGNVYFAKQDFDNALVQYEYIRDHISNTSNLLYANSKKRINQIRKKIWSEE